MGGLGGDEDPDPLPSFAPARVTRRDGELEMGPALETNHDD
jgi:hypothetical protein